MDIREQSTGAMDYSRYKLTSSLELNIEIFKEIFNSDDTIRFRQVAGSDKNAPRCCVIFADGMVSGKTINDNIILPIQQTGIDESDYFEQLRDGIIAVGEMTETDDVNDMIDAILSGSALVLADGCQSSLAVSVKGFATRGISEPDNEKSLRGPREGFNESIITNLSMLRRKISTPDMKIEFSMCGTRTRTKYCIVYIDGLAQPHILEKLKRRLEKIELDSLLDANYIEEYIRDAPYSLFKTIGSSEKPDTVAARLLEGRIAVIVDGTPVVLTLPYLFIENLQAADDYYITFYYGTIGRLLRFTALFISLCVPAIYVALLHFHNAMIPTSLLLSIIASDKGVPFPVIVEVLGMLFVFELLRETGIRMPNKIGHALSIVGALVVGQAAVEAKLVSAPVVIIVALAGITGLMLPRLNTAIITIRIAMAIAASILGLFGVFLCLIALAVYLLGLKSFGLPYMSQMFSLRPVELGDIYMRSRITYMRYRPDTMAKDESRRP